MRFVEPVNYLPKSEERIIEFMGLNRKHVVDDGEMSDMLNLTADGYPLLTQRKPRGSYDPIITESGDSRVLVQVHSLNTRFEKIFMIADIKDDEESEDIRTRFIFDGEVVSSILDITSETRTVCINTKICFFPQKTYLQLIRKDDGSIETGAYGSFDAETSAGGFETDYSILTKPADSWIAYGEIDSQATLKSFIGDLTNDKHAKVKITGTLTSFLDGHETFVIEGRDENGELAGFPLTIFAPPQTGGITKTDVANGYSECGIGVSLDDVAWLVLKAALAVKKQQTDLPASAVTSITVANEPGTNDPDISLDIITTDDGLRHERVSFDAATMADLSDIHVGDAVTITGTIFVNGKKVTYYGTDSISCIVDAVQPSYSVGGTAVDAYIEFPSYTFMEMTSEGVQTATVGQISIERKSPDLDTNCVLEYNNRLWGASSKDNTIYACKLGDPLNWQYYQGTSVDSYFAEQGTDGDFTGCAGYAQHIMFFKESSIAKVYGTAPASWQITNTKCYGLTADSPKSVSIINNMVFYKSSIGLMCYEGGDPYAVSDKLNCKFSNVVCGTEGRKLYMSYHNDDTNEQELLVMDIDKAQWHKSDDTLFVDTCTLNGSLYFVDDTGLIKVINPNTDVEGVTVDDEPIEWMAQFGPFDEWIEYRKIYSRLLMRINAPTFPEDGSGLITISIKVDDGDRAYQTGWQEMGVYAPSEDGWQEIKTFSAPINDGERIPIVPRRCDHYTVRIEGNVPCEIKSLTRTLRKGSMNKL